MKKFLSLVLALIMTMSLVRAAGVWYVAAGENITSITVASGKGTGVIDASRGASFGAAITQDNTLATDKVYTAATEVETAAGKTGIKVLAPTL